MNYYNEIKKELINNEVYKKVKDYSKNKSDLSTYYNVGKLLSDAGKKYGEGIIKRYSIRLSKEIGKGYSERNLRNMRQYYRLMQKSNLADSVCQITWSHIIEIVWFQDLNKINYYIDICTRQNLSVRKLKEKIKNSEYERLPEETKKKLVNKEEIKINDFIKNPIIIRNKYRYHDISEKVLKDLILEDIPSFLKELGDGFCFIDSEYKIKIGNTYNYIDLLLFNYVYNAFVVVELKVTELRKEHIGQIEVYMNYIDKNIKSINQDKTIGIIISKKDNKFVIEYASDKRIFNSTYVLN